MGTYLLGLDNGSTMIKAAVFDLDGNELGAFTGLAEPVSPRPNWYERDMDEVWRANAVAIHGAIEAAGVDAADIAALSVTGHGNGAYLVDGAGKSVRNAIIGTDSRALDYLDTLAEQGYYSVWHGRTMQNLWPGMTLPVMCWLRDHESESYRATRWCFGVVDYVRWRLTGEALWELSSASSTGLVDTAGERVDPELLRDFGLAELAEKLPPLIRSYDMAGRVTEDAAAETGLRAGTPVYGGCFDVDAAALATGTVDESLITVIAGSWANNQYIGKEPVVSRDFFSTTVFSRPGYWLMLEGSPTSASNLEWFVGEFLEEERKAAKARGESVYDLCNRAVAETAEEEADLVFIPFLFGSNAGPRAKGCFIGLQGWMERRHIIRAVYEGVCFSHRYHIEKLLRHLPRPRAARMSGGGAKSAVWAQMFADTLQMKMEIPAATELGTLGAAICAGIGSGLYADTGEAVARAVRVRHVVEPNAEKQDIYDQKYDRYLAAIKALEGYWR